jgi:hypothetical protein
LRVTRYIRQHHIGLIALFIALTGTAYAGTQVANRPANPHALKAKKKKKDRRGPAGPVGPQGAPGAPGAARAYGHVNSGSLVAADSTGIAAMTRGCQSNSACTGPPAPGSQSNTVYCFQLDFAPKSVQVTPDAGQSAGGAASVATDWMARVPARGPAINHEGCPPGYDSAQVDAFSTAGTFVVTGFWVTFN